MVQLNDIQERGIFKVTIYPEYAFPEGSEERDAWAGAELTLRELDSSEANVAYQGDENRKEFLKVFRKALADHNVYKGESTKASAEEVMKLVESSSSVYTYVIQEWSSSLPLRRRRDGNSDS